MSKNRERNFKAGAKKTSTEASSAKKSVRSSPTQDVDLFTYGKDVRRSNFLANKEKLSKYALREYGILGQIIKDMEYPNREPPIINFLDPMYDALTDRQKRKVQDTTIAEWSKENHDIEKKKIQFFGFLLSLLTDEGEAKVRKTNGWVIAERNKDPLALWRLIVLTHSVMTEDMSAQEAQGEAEKKYYRGRQFSGETELDYFRRFSQNLDVMRAVGLDMPTDAAIAYRFLDGLDPTKHSEMMRTLRNNVRRGIEEFPTSLEDAFDFVNEYIPYHPYAKSTTNQDRGEPAVYSTEANSCKECGRTHRGACWGKNFEKKRDNRQQSNAKSRERRPVKGSEKEESAEAHSASSSVKVHDSDRKKKNEKKTEKPKKAMVCDDSDSNSDDDYLTFTFTKEQDDECESIPDLVSDDSSVDDDEDDIQATVESFGLEKAVKRARVVAEIVKMKKLPDTFVFLDSGANIHLFHDGAVDLLTDVRANTDESVRVKGVGGKTVVDTVGTLACFGDVYIGGPHMLRTNLLAFSEVEDRYKVKYRRRIGFDVHVSDNIVLAFRRIGNNLYGCDLANYVDKLRELDSSGGAEVDVTVDELKSQYSVDEVRRAKEAREFMRKLGYPSVRDMVKLIVKGGIINCPVTVDDIVRAEKLFGPDVASLKGKTTKRKVSGSQRIEVPRSSTKEQKFYSDIFFWREQGFLLTLAKPLDLMFISPLTKSTTKAYYRELLQGHIDQMSSHGFRVTMIHVDPEKALAALEHAFPDIVVDVTGAKRHVRIIERAIRTVKERMRATEAGLPFKVPRRFVVGIGRAVVARLNIFPASASPDALGPRELFTGIKLDYKRDLKFSVGDYVQTYESLDKTNGPEERTRGCIALYPLNNKAGSWKFYSLSSDREISRDDGAILPMPDVVIDRLKIIYDADERVFDAIADARMPVPDRIQQPAGGVVGPHPHVQRIDDLVRRNEELHDAAEYMHENPILDDNAPFEDGDNVYDHGVEDMGVHSEGVDDVDDGDELPPRASYKQRAMDAASEFSARARESGVDTANAKELQNSGSVKVGGRRVSARLRAKRKASVFNLTITKTKAFQKYATDAEKAALSEITKICDRGTLQVVDRRTLTLPQLRKLIRSAMIFQEKYNLDGVFTKLKARMVARGNEMDKELYPKESTTSPTVSTTHLFVLLAIAAIEKRKIRTIDIGNAFLEADINLDVDDEEVFVELDPLCTRLLSQVDLTITPHIDNRGRVVCRLKKALYGCLQSARLWYLKLKSVLIEYGFVENPHDPCVFNVTRDGCQCTIGVHVDDLLITCKKQGVLDDVTKFLITKFNEVKVHDGDEHEYLGMRVRIINGGITVDMCNYVSECIKWYGVEGTASTPSQSDLFDTPVSPFLDRDERERFHSMVAKLLFVAKRTRPDILLTVSHLSSRVAEPTEDDSAKLTRLLKYLNGTSEYLLYFDSSAEISIEGLIDASFCVHEDGRSRTGLQICMAGCTVLAMTSKQKVTAKSSTEAEIIGLSDFSSEVMGLREFLLHQGYKMSATRVYQDNKGVMALIKSGKSNSYRTRHLKARYFFIKDHIEQGDIALEYMPTKQMTADVLTKPLGGSLFKSLVSKLLGYKV